MAREIQSTEAAMRQLDALIAEHVMGWTKISLEKTISGEEKIYGKPPDQQGMDLVIPEYSTDIAAAWEVVEKLRSMGKDIELRGHAPYEPDNWQVVVNDEFYTEGPAPLAICLAALKAKGI